MDFREKLKSQRNKVVYSITDKCILIGGYQGSGKTPIMHELSNILTEEYNDEFVTLMFPLEKRYTNYDIRKYIPPELNYYDKNKVLLIEKCSEGNLNASKISFIRILNMLDEEIKESVMNVIGCDIETLFNKKILDINLTIDKINKLAIQTRKMILDKEPTNYTSFLHLVDGVAEIKKQKMLDKDYSLKIAIFDPLTIVEDYAKEYLLWEVFDRTKKAQTENEYGGARRGAIYFDATKLIFDNIIKPLNSVGIETWFTFHTKLKGFKDKITDIEYDTYTSRNTSNIFGKVLDMADYSMIFEDTMFISNGMSGSKEDRILRWRNGGNYTGCKATAELEKIPSVQNVKGLSDKEIARLIYDTIVNSLKPKDISDSQFKIETKNQELEMKNKNDIKNDTMLQIDGIGDNVEKEKSTKVLFVSNLETLLKTVNDSSRVQLENYLKTVTGEKSISDWVSDVNKDTFNKVADTINNAISGIDGIEKLPRLE